MKEIWKDIIGYEELYQVSNLGRVKNLIFKNKYGTYKRERILKNQPKKNGYYQVCLYKDEVAKNFLVHRLVAKAFIPNLNNLPEINHKDENPANNCVNNLEWCNSKYNSNYGTHIEKLSKPIICVELNTIFPSLREASRKTGISKGHISEVCKGKRKTAGKFHWKCLCEEL